jgi:endonuclease/exonuclease/phosphatase family metal-dependent hydrolase
VARPVRFLFYNTYLLWVLRLPGGVEVGAKPGVAARACELGQTLPGQYDVMALCEVFNRRELEAILDGWTSRPEVALGPHRRGLPVLGKPSGLATIADGYRIMRTDRHVYRERGQVWRDTDALSSKGVLLTEVDLGVGPGRLEVYSTHLIMGNDVVRRPGSLHRANDRVRFDQVDELLDFVERTHDSANTALVVGDFNIPAYDPLEPTSPSSDYERLRTRFDADGFDDLWRNHGDGPGFTYGLDHVGDAICVPDPDAPEFCAEPAGPQTNHKPLRLDYAFLLRPDDRQRIAVDVMAFRRRSFPRLPGTEGYEDLAFLSDHLGLHLELGATAR